METPEQPAYCDESYNVSMIILTTQKHLNAPWTMESKLKATL